MAAAVEVEALCASYGRVQVLFDIDLAVESGETLALLGTNGAGKSTLLKAISGLMPCASGRLRLLGQDVGSMAPERRVAMGLAHLVGGSSTFGPLTVDENLAAAAHRYGKGERHRRVAESHDLFPGLAKVRHSPAASLSGGQEQMLALAMALVHEPAVLLIDELSLGLAPLVVQDVLARIRKLQAAGTTLVIVEQSLNVALSIADRAVFLEHGRVHFEGPASELLERDDLARTVFLGA